MPEETMKGKNIHRLRKNGLSYSSIWKHIGITLNWKTTSS